VERLGVVDGVVARVEVERDPRLPEGGFDLEVPAAAKRGELLRGVDRADAELSKKRGEDLLRPPFNQDQPVAKPPQLLVEDS